MEEKTKKKLHKPVRYGEYILLDRLNVGGMAEVFRAKKISLEGVQRLVAIKRILPHLARDPEFAEMFIDEARISTQLNHTNIAQVYQLGRIDDSLFISMEYISGKDLRALINRMHRNKQLLPVALVVFVMAKVCEGLQYAHTKLDDITMQELNIVHRDISPQNIIISYQGEVKIIDFGIAKAASKRTHTEAGILKGKFGYMAPEQVMGEKIDRRADIFCVGILLYEMLTGERLFAGSNELSTLKKIRKAEVPPPSLKNPNFPKELERILLKALAENPDDRYQYAIDLQADLEAFQRTLPEPYNSLKLREFIQGLFAEDIEKDRKKLQKLLQFKLDEDLKQPYDDKKSSTIQLDKQQLKASQESYKEEYPNTPPSQENPFTPSAYPSGSFEPHPSGSFEPHPSGSFEPHPSGSFEPHPSGSFDPASSGSFEPHPSGSFDPASYVPSSMNPPPLPENYAASDNLSYRSSSADSLSPPPYPSSHEDSHSHSSPFVAPASSSQQNPPHFSTPHSNAEPSFPPYPSHPEVNHATVADELAVAPTSLEIGVPADSYPHIPYPPPPQDFDDEPLSPLENQKKINLIWAFLWTFMAIAFLGMMYLLLFVDPSKDTPAPSQNPTSIPLPPDFPDAATLKIPRIPPPRIGLDSYPPERKMAPQPRQIAIPKRRPPIKRLRQIKRRKRKLHRRRVVAIRFRSVPHHASIFIDQKFKGFTPKRLIFYPRKHHYKLRLEKEGYQNYTLSFPVHRNDRGYTINATLIPKKKKNPPKPPVIVRYVAPGFLTIKGDPLSLISINGKSTGRYILYQYKLRPGTYSIGFGSPNSKIHWVEKIVIRSGQTIRKISKYKK